MLPQQPKFFQSLESLRGIAALMVALSHSLGALSIVQADSAFYKKLLTIAGNGGVGVIVFFVLSGFVLTCSVNTSGRTDFMAWLGFWLRRCFRIFPALIVATLFCALILSMFSFTYAFEAGSAELYHYWQQGISWSLLAGNLLLTNNYVNPVTWTLEIEVLGALFFPLIYCIGKSSRTAVLLLLALWIAAFLLTPLFSYARTGFVFMFVMGLLAHDLGRWLTRFSVTTLKWLAATAFVLCCLSNLVPPAKEVYAWVREAVLAMILIASLTAITEEKQFAVLVHRYTRFLGKISYSFYLLHFPVGMLVLRALFNIVPAAVLLNHPNFWQLVLFVISTALTILLAAGCYFWLEKPFMNAAKKFWSLSFAAPKVSET